MKMRRWLLAVCFLGMGCHSLTGDMDIDRGPSPAKELWDKGQEAMRQGQPEQAIGFYEQSLAADGALTCNFLSLAAANLECGKEDMASIHLAKYVQCHPEHLSVRAHHAELLLRLNRRQEARVEFERLIEDAQEKGDESIRQIIHCHGRLMELAEKEDNAYEASLHRGIGLYLLARRCTELAGADNDLPADGVLMKAAGELHRARELRPQDARPCWYLYEVWRALAQQQPARHWLRTAQEMAPFSTLTPVEQRGLYLAGQSPEKRF